MKRIIALVLTGTLFLGIVLSGCGKGGARGDNPAAEDLSAYEYGEINYEEDLSGFDQSLTEKTIGELDRETLEKAIVQVCFSYYWKNPYTQYDMGFLCYDVKDAKRRTTYQSPEQTDYDEMWYSQCSEYCYDVYWDLCHYEFIGERMKGTSVEGKIDEATWVASNKTLGWEEGPITQLVVYDARPGDIAFGAGTQGDGHLLMNVGDVDGDGKNEVLHCWPLGGGTFNRLSNPETDGKQKWEKEGAIAFQHAEDVLIKKEGTPNWCLFTEKNDKHWQYYRPFEQEDIKSCHMTTDTASRLSFPDIAISKTLNKSIHNSYVRDEDMIFTVKITNNSAEDYKDLPVTEYVPDYTVLKEADANCTADGRKLKWTVNVPAGETVELTYTVTNKRSDGFVSVPAGLVAGIHTRTMEIQIAKTAFSEEQMAVFKNYAETKKLPEGVNLTGVSELEFVNEFYKQALGMEVKLPKTVMEFQNALFEERNGVQSCQMGKMLFKKDVTEENRYYNDMIIRNQIGGLYYSTGAYQGAGAYKTERIMDIQECYFEPGDVFVSYSGNSKRSLESGLDLEFYIYLGDGKVLSKSGNLFGVTDYASTLELQLSKHFMFALRPRLNN